MAENVDGPDQGVLFEIEDKDEDGCLWICNPVGTEPQWCQNLGPREAVMEKWAAFLAEQDFEEK